MSETSVQDIAIKRAVKMLEAAGAKFKVIAASGDEYGELEVVVKPAKPKRGQWLRDLGFEPGALCRHIRSHIEPIQPGKTGVVPYIKGVSADEMQKRVVSMVCEAWGKGAYISHRNAKGIELLRMESAS